MIVSKYILRLMLPALFLILSSFLQANKPDSLIILLEKDYNDLLLQDKVREEIRKNLYEQPAAGAERAKRVMKIAEGNSLHDLQTHMLLNIGISYDLRGNYDSALIIYDKALLLARSHNLELLEGDIYNNCGIVYAFMGEFGKSLDFGIKALNIYENLGDSLRLAKIYNNLGSRYSEMRINDKALEYYNKAIDINLKRNDNTRLSYNYGNIGTIYSLNDENEKALEYYSKAFELQSELNNPRNLSITLGNLAIVYQNMKEYDLSLQHARHSYELALQTNDELGKVTYFNVCARTYLEQEKYDESLDCYLQAKNLAEKIGARQTLMEIYQGLAELYAIRKDYEKAFSFKEKFLTERIYVLDSQKNKALQMLEGYENIKTQNEIDLLTKDSEIQKLELKRQKTLRNSMAGMGVMLLILSAGLAHRYFYVRRNRNRLAGKNLQIEKEKQKADQLLLNILPKETADELKETGKTTARRFDDVSVMFTDFIGFTRVAEQLSAEDLVKEVDCCFSAFDEIISSYHIEKIKTIGDAYMCAGGLPIPENGKPADVIRAALEIVDFMNSYNQTQLQKGMPVLEIRIGIHTGPVVAGIVGTRKFAYDIWGDTVNIASRMEHSSQAGKVNISESTYALVKDIFRFEYRGKIEARNKGKIDMYFVE